MTLKTSVNFVYKHICEVILVFLLGYFFFTKDVTSKYDKVIMVDGLGYYAYLPATFIYHDYTFSFFNEMHDKYDYVVFSDPATKQFTTEIDGISLDKYYQGVSLLWLPFFLLAHLIAGSIHSGKGLYRNPCLSPVFNSISL